MKKILTVLASVLIWCAAFVIALQNVSIGICMGIVMTAALELYEHADRH